MTKEKLPKEFKETFEALKELITYLTDDLETVADEMEELENNEFVDSVTYKIPGHIYSQYDTSKNSIKKLISKLDSFGKEDEELDWIWEYTGNLQAALTKFEKTYDEDTIDDCSEVYDLAYELNIPLEDIESILESDYK
jgi:hypothetical protein